MIVIQSRDKSNQDFHKLTIIFVFQCYLLQRNDWVKLVANCYECKNFRLKFNVSRTYLSFLYCVYISSIHEIDFNLTENKCQQRIFHP